MSSIITFYLIIILFQYILTGLSVRKAKIQYTKYELKQSDRIPQYYKNIFKTPVRELKSLEFIPIHYLEARKFLSFLSTAWEVLLYHRETKTYAILGIRYPLEPVYTFDIEFCTVLKDKTLLQTMNGKLHGVLDTIPNTIVQDVYADRISLQWQAHQDKLNELTQTNPALGLHPQTFLKVFQNSVKVYLDGLAKAKKIVPFQDPGVFQHSWFSTLKLTHKLIRGKKKTTALVKRRQQQAKTDASMRIDIPIEIEIEQFEHLQRQNRGLVGHRLRTWLLWGSLGVFVAAVIPFVSSFNLLILLAALLLHEGGHVLAMKFCEYKDTSMLFIPFLGAVATARQKEDATIAQKFAVLIAGPLPGLILGIGLAIAAYDNAALGWANNAAWVLIGLNLFNLLPIYPLDGGRIIDLLLFSRYPYFGILFQGFGVIVLFLFGLGNPILMVFPFFIATTIPNSFRSAKAHAKLRKTLRDNLPSDRHNFLHAIFASLKQLGYQKLPFATRHTLAKDLMQRRYELRNRWVTRIGLFVLYCSSLFGGVAGILQAAYPGWWQWMAYAFETPEQIQQRMQVERQQEIDRATAAIAANPNDIEAYYQRAQAQNILGNTHEAKADYDRVVSIAPDEVRSYLERASFYTQMKNYPEAILDYDRALALTPNDPIVYDYRANVRYQSGDFAGAIADYTKVIELDREDFWAYIQRGSTRLEMADYPGAIADANAAIDMDASEAEAYYLRAEARRLSGDEAGAIADEQIADALY
ncbi:MAG: tetratricopeptide repeat protein [Cyanobacteriota bacterium]|nr:tetratricopeptide repeat protein [Cyanobacteriota bacterium]